MAKNTEKWGKDTARERYGSGSKAAPRATEVFQKPQFPTEKHDANYDNDAPDNWLRGNGMKPGFDRKKAGR